MKKNNRNQFLVLSGICLSMILLFSSLVGCATSVKAEEIPADLSKAVLFQRAQDYINANNYPAASTYLITLKERYADDSEANIEADYLLAQIEYKQGNYLVAQESFTALLKLYEGEEGAKLPPKIKVLSNRLLEMIEAKLGPLLASSTSSSSSSSSSTSSTSSTTTSTITAAE